MLYDILYASAARDGRESALFGGSAALAHVAFERSLACEAFPELWFEIPLAGEPWFDLHALTAREDLPSNMGFSAERTGGCPEAFRWFAQQGPSARQLALSWDTGRGDVGQPAVQLLASRDDVQMTCGFLEAVGRADAVSAYRRFFGSLPDGWFACYTGVFPGRQGHNLRVECIPSRGLQRAYADDAALLEGHLRQTGLREFGDTLVERCQQMAKAPCALEFQFDVEPDGRAGTTFGASLRFAQPPGNDRRQSFSRDGAAADLMRQVQAWGLADGRWRLLADTMFAKRVSFGSASCILYCYPAFLKLRWHAGEPLDAKAYLIAGVQ